MDNPASRRRAPGSFPRALARLRLAVFAGFAAAVPLRSQTAPAPRPAAAEPVIELSPFIIATEKETGWSANDTLTATRTKQALKDVPVNIDAITSDFMEDLGLFTADETAQFVANVFAAPVMENDNQGGNFSFRGLSQSNNVSRNYFRWFIPSDTYNVERIDFGKGSNSLIFGEVEPGGQGAVFTKRPLLRNFGTATAFYNSEGAYRYQLDVNRKLRSNLAARFNAVRRQEKTFQDASAYKFEGETLAVVWQPFRHTSIRVEGEQGKYDNRRGFAGISVYEQSARGRGFSAAGTYYTSDGQWIVQSALPAVDRGGGNGVAGGTPSLVEGGFYDIALRNAAGAVVGTRRYAGLPKHYNLRGSFDQQARPFNTYSVTVEQGLGPVSVEFSYNHQNQQSDRNDNAFDTTIGFDAAGRPFTDAASDRKRFGTETDAFRGSVVYPWTPFKGMTQLLVASAEYREHAVDNYRLQGYNVKRVLSGAASAIDIANDRGRLRVYLDDPAFYSRALYDRVQFSNPPVTDQVDMRMLGFFASGTDAANGTSWSRSAAASVSASGRYFGGRLQSLIGLRHDRNRLYEYTTSRYFGPFREAIQPPKRQDALPGDYRENLGQRLSATTATAGLTFALNKDVNVYGVYSESFRFQDAVTFDNVRFGPIEGTTKEIGLKGSFFDGRAGFTLGVFDIDRKNVVLSYNNVIGLNAVQLEDLMNPNDVLPGDPRYRFSAPGTASAARNYRSTENSTGADLTLLLRPTKNLQLRFTLARTRVLGEPDLASFRGYYNAAVARGNEAPAVLATAKLLLDSLDISTRPAGARASPWSASWIVDYGFDRGAWAPLRGVRAGVNGSWRDDYLFGVPSGQSMVGGSSHLTNAYVMRDQKLWGRQVRVRAGVKYLSDLENGALRKTGFTTLANGANVYTYSYVMPPQYDLTVTVRF
jgi:outer membrane receptor protein involved in Fe transport